MIQTGLELGFAEFANAAPFRPAERITDSIASSEKLLDVRNHNVKAVLISPEGCHHHDPVGSDQSLFYCLYQEKADMYGRFHDKGANDITKLFKGQRHFKMSKVYGLPSLKKKHYVNYTGLVSASVFKLVLKFYI